MGSIVDIVDLVSAAMEVAKRTGGVIRDVLEHGALGVVEKADGANTALAEHEVADVDDPQTVADRRGQAVIVESLRLRWPDLRLVGEEGKVEVEDAVRHLVSAPEGRDAEVEREVAARLGQDARTFPVSELVVWIDPLDGTKAFTRGEKEGVTVLIGVSRAGRALAGVVHRPWSGQTAWGVVGACSGGIPFVAAERRDAARRRVVSSTHHATEKLRNFIKSVSPTETCSASGGANKALLVLTGEMDAWVYPSPGTKRWDTCAVEAVVRGYGGTLTDSFGDDIVYEPSEDERRLNNSRGVLCTVAAHASYVLDKRHERDVDTVNFPPPPASGL